MDYRLYKVTRDRVSTFATIFLVISTLHPGPLPDLPTSSKSETQPYSNPPAIVAQQEEAFVNHPEEAAIEQGGFVGDVEIMTANDEQSIDDMLQDQPEEVAVE